MAATSAGAQVQVDARLEKSRYLAGEPVVVLIDVRNVGDEPVGYSDCDGSVRLSVTNVQRRAAPNIFGCSMGGAGGSGCGSDHVPLLHPGGTTTFQYLLRDFDLRPGSHELVAAGRAGVRSQRSQSVPGATFTRTLALDVVEASETQLKAALAPHVADANSADPGRRHHSRNVLVESAAPFLESLIARFAREDEEYAIDALRRIGTTTSRRHLRSLFHRANAAKRSAVVYALAQIGHRDDSSFLAGVLRDRTVDLNSRRYAALGLGRIGGDRSVVHLARALTTASQELRTFIATALGNSRSAAAVPVLIGMVESERPMNDVCGPLATLTHRSWCGSSDLDATRKRWLRWWNEYGASVSIFGPDNCPADRLPRIEDQ